MTEERASLLEARIRVDLDEPRLELVVDHEVVAEDLEAVAFALRVQLARVDRLERHNDDVADFAKVNLKEVNVLAGLLEVFLRFLEAQLVALF